MGNNTFFDFTCSAPLDGVHFVSAPRVRGTLDIAWSCLAVLLLSTWDISNTHDIPAPSVIPKTRWARRRKVLRECWGKTVDMIVAILVPEWLTVNAIFRHVKARSVFRDGRKHLSGNEVDWCMSMAYFANMAGFIITFDDDESEGSQSIEQASRHARMDEEERMLDAVENGNELRATSSNLKGAMHDPTIRIRLGQQLLYLRQIGVLRKLPPISADELNDRNKSSALLQTLALVQTSWLITSVIVRYTKHLVVTQVEIVTLAFAVLNFITRVVDWHKPKDVRTPVMLSSARRLTEPEVTQLGLLEEDASRLDWTSYTVGILAGVLFGGLHCLAWYEDFPTGTERMLWRIAAVFTTCFPGLTALMAVLHEYMEGETVVALTLGILMCCYTVARLFVMIETIRVLFYQSPSAFVGTWAVNFPHLS